MIISRFEILRISHPCIHQMQKKNALLHLIKSVRDVNYAVPPLLFCTIYITSLQNLSFTTITESPGCIKATPRWFSNKFLSKHFQLMYHYTVFLSGTFLYSTVLFNVFSCNYIIPYPIFCKVFFVTKKEHTNRYIPSLAGEEGFEPP